MAWTLISETEGEDTTSQLWRDAGGGYHVRIQTKPPEGGDDAGAAQPVRIFHEQAVSSAEARLLYATGSATRHLGEDQAFPA